MFDYGVCFGGMLRGYASGYASRSVKTKVIAFPEGMLQGMLLGYASGYASPKSNIPVLHKLDTLKKRQAHILPLSIEIQQGFQHFATVELHCNSKTHKGRRNTEQKN